jgi:hypothetical protein
MAGNTPGTAKQVPQKRKWYIPVAWLGTKLRCGQPTASEAKAAGLLRDLSGDLKNAFTVEVELPERIIDSAPAPEEQ